MPDPEEEIDLSQLQRFPVVYPAKAQFKSGSNENAQAGATAKLQFSLNNNPHEITGLRVRNVYEIPDEYLLAGFGPDWLQRKDGEQDLVVRMAQQNIVVDEANQVSVLGNDGIHWHPFELPYPFRGGNTIIVNVTRTTNYRWVVLNAAGEKEEILIDSVTVSASLVGWMYVGPGGVLPGPPSSGFAAFLNSRGQ